MTEQPLYNEFPQFLRRYFPYKVQKIYLHRYPKRKQTRILSVHR